MCVGVVICVCKAEFVPVGVCDKCVCLRAMCV